MELIEVIKRLLAEPYGCPMCDSGKLRNPEKQHWDDCPYLLAEKAISQDVTPQEDREIKGEQTKD